MTLSGEAMSSEKSLELSAEGRREKAGWGYRDDSTPANQAVGAMSMHPSLSVARRKAAQGAQQLAAGVERTLVCRQPIVPLTTRAPVRWDELLCRPRELLPGESVQPWIELVDRCGLLPRLDVVMVAAACDYVARTPAGSGWVSVNVAPSSLLDSASFHRLELSIQRLRIRASRICLEVSELQPASNPCLLVRRVKRLRQLGVRVAIDDFGAGFSHLILLATGCVDVVKTGRALLHCSRREALLELLRYNACALNVLLVVEGVESARELALAKRIQVDAVQGYFMGPPCPPERRDAITAKY